MEAEALRLPDDFLIGTATAGLQIEGGPARNSWYRWADEGRISDGSHPSRANDHWRRVEEDVGLLRELGCRTHRMGVEWHRIEPEEGRFDRVALSHYRREIELLMEAGIVPLVTLHHFTNPLWLEDDGGWLDDRVVARFARYARFVATELCDLVTDWVTINEPNVYLLEGYVLGAWPPGRRSIGDYLRGAKTMIRAHIAAYRSVHEVARSRGVRPRVGVAHHLRVFDPAGRLLTPLLARMAQRMVQSIFLEGMTCGELVFPLGGRLPEAVGGPPYSDFVGVNYYTRDIVGLSRDPRTLFTRMRTATGVPTNDLGWEIYPGGLARLVRACADRYALPVWITENGTCDATDAFRSDYLVAHLREVAMMIDEGIPVERYYHWTLVDNFEWIEGESARFGLVACDFPTQRRTVRSSGRLFARICATGLVPADGAASPGDK